MREFADAKRALGFGVVFFGYAAWLAWDRWMHNRRLSQETRARLILSDAASRRGELTSAEGIE